MIGSQRSPVDGWVINVSIGSSLQRSIWAQSSMLRSVQACVNQFELSVGDPPYLAPHFNSFSISEAVQEWERKEEEREASFRQRGTRSLFAACFSRHRKHLCNGRQELQAFWSNPTISSHFGDPLFWILYLSPAYLPLRVIDVQVLLYALLAPVAVIILRPRQPQRGVERLRCMWCDRRNYAIVRITRMQNILGQYFLVCW